LLTYLLTAPNLTTEWQHLAMHQTNRLSDYRVTDYGNNELGLGLVVS